MLVVLVMTQGEHVAVQLGLHNHSTVQVLCVIRWTRRVVSRLIRIYLMSLLRFMSEYPKKHA